MNFTSNSLYHVYNRGNNGGMIFFSEANYLFFKRKMRKYIAACSDILAYCLMPNHFHLLIGTKENARCSIISDNISVLLRSYTQAINIQNKTTGSLFQQKTKAKLLEAGDAYYPFTCLNYIHQNPLRAGLVSKLEDWEYSSFRDYAGYRDDKLCNKDLAIQLFDLPVDPDEFYKMSNELS